MPASILIVDDEKHTREGLKEYLEDDYDIYLAASADEAFNVMESSQMDVVITDLRMAGKSGIKVIDKALSLSNPPVVMMMTAYGNVESAVEAMKHGAYDFLTKPLNLEKLEIIIKRALKSRKTEQEVEVLHQRLDKKFSFTGIVGNSSAISEVIDRVKLVAPSRATVLVEGETGTGKELIAQAIHQNSDRSRAPFVAVHCAALAANLLESELFGHEKGAFTGAMEKRVGRFEGADGGTLFLDEIGEIDASIQVKLLRFLETRSIERLGSMKPVQLDIRLVVATNRDLEDMVRKGTFREDLFYRLNVVRIKTPPLRDRRDDIPLLLDHYVNIFSQENGFNPVTFDPDVSQILQGYNWPGNIRELRNFAENMVVMRRGGRVTRFDLDQRFMRTDSATAGAGAQTAGASQSMPVSIPSSPLSVEENEKRLIHNALQEARGNRTKAATLLGMSRRTLHRKLAQWPELDSRG
ncbi:MAG: sigma-54-dependent Fis family transcriptional regulator [Opitutales bacterium]|nr:sigma-54-dependent Fis family transcriptional regulator [Opitutales bacterium]